MAARDQFARSQTIEYIRHIMTARFGRYRDGVGVIMIRFLFAVAALLLPSAANAAGKRDVYGFTPGMTYEAARALASERQYPECNFQKALIQSGISCNGAALWFAPSLEDNPLMLVFAPIRATASRDEIVASISQQFGKTLRHVQGQRPVAEYFEAELGDDILLRLTIDGREVRLLNTAVQKRWEAEELRRSHVPIPKL